VPAFMKNARKAKTAEAVANVKRLYDGAMAARAADPQHRFPKGTLGPTPPLGACCGKGGKCMPYADEWTDPIWRALGFSIDDPHYFAYSYTSDGQTFTARANGDLNCNGVYSTFEMLGKDGDASPTLYRDKELE